MRFANLNCISPQETSLYLLQLITQGFWDLGIPHAIVRDETKYKLGEVFRPSKDTKGPFGSRIRRGGEGRDFNGGEGRGGEIF